MQSHLWRGTSKDQDPRGWRENYTYCCTVTTRVTPALKWAVMRPTSKYHWLCIVVVELWGAKSQGSVHKPRLKRKEANQGIGLILPFTSLGPYWQINMSLWSGRVRWLPSKLVSGVVSFCCTVWCQSVGYFCIGILQSQHCPHGIPLVWCSTDSCTV